MDFFQVFRLNHSNLKGNSYWTHRGGNIPHTKRAYMLRAHNVTSAELSSTRCVSLYVAVNLFLPGIGCYGAAQAVCLSADSLCTTRKNVTVHWWLQRYWLRCQSKEAAFPMWRINRFLLALYNATYPCCNNFKCLSEKACYHWHLYDPSSGDLKNSALWFWHMQQPGFSLLLVYRRIFNSGMWVMKNVSLMHQYTRYEIKFMQIQTAVEQTAESKCQSTQRWQFVWWHHVHVCVVIYTGFPEA